MDDKKQWAWSRLGNDYANGPFLTREEAIADAVDSGELDVDVGHVEWIDPAEYIDVDLDTMIESTEERAHDQDGWSGDDALIEVAFRPQEQELTDSHRLPSPNEGEPVDPHHQ